MEEKTVKIDGHEITIHELTTEQESRIRASSQVWNSKKKMPEVDQAKLDANIMYYSIVASTWPAKDWGTLSPETIQKLPSKLTRKLLGECQRLNVLDEDIQAFLDSRQSSQNQTQPEETSS